MQLIQIPKCLGYGASELVDFHLPHNKIDFISQKTLLNTHKLIKSDNFPSVSGMVPLRWFEAKSLNIYIYITL